MGWFILLGVVAVALGHGNFALSGVYFGIGLFGLYRISLERHPRRVCRACGGTGRHRGAMFWWGDRQCTTCAGNQRHRRWGVQMFHGGPGEQAWAERAVQRARGRRGAPR